MLIREGPAEGVLELRLNRPGKLNALTTALARELLDAVRAANADQAVRAIVLSGEGRAFCAGKDLGEPADQGLMQVLQQLAAALMDSPKPVVAAAHGWCVGAGLELLLNCDVVTASPDARFKLPEVSVGLFGTGGVLALLPRKIGLAKAKGALMLGQEFSALQAEQWGLIWSVSQDARQEARLLAAQLAAADPAILGALKSLLHRESIGELAGVLQREAQAHARLAAR